MGNTIKKSYDEIPYSSGAFFNTNPRNLEAIALLLSLTPPPSKTANVLEIGCSFGGNLFPFALANPDAKVIGVDLSSVQIDKAKQLAKKFKLKNIDFIQKDISQFSKDDVGDMKFDYIICHGVYSWVPEFVREAILTKIKEFLSPNGIAYISYNVYPGWKVKDSIRDILLFATKDINLAKNKIKKAREVLKTLGEYYKFCCDNDLDMRVMGCAELANVHIKQLDNSNDSYILHEFLEEFNQPFYFKDFANDLNRHELAYLFDTNLEDIFKSNLGIEKFDKFINQNFKNRIEKEQAMDFFTNKVFRSSLITHKQNIQNMNLNIEIGPQELSKIHLSARFTKEGEKFKSIVGKEMNPKYNWLYEVFNDVYPASINFQDLAPLVKDDEKLLENAYFGMFEILSSPTSEISAQPQEKIVYEATKSRLKQNYIPYFKHFSQSQDETISLADCWGMNIAVTQLECFLALQFDGKNTLEDIEKILINLIKNKAVNVSYENDESIDINDKDMLTRLAKNMVETLSLELCNHKFLETIS